MVTDVQTRGRGRTGKKWQSPRGGLWFSVIVRPDIPLGKLGLLQFLCSNAVRQSLERETGVGVQVKWPNDLILDSGKLGGILVESKNVGEQVSYVIIGVGLNVNLKEKQLPVEATSVYLRTGKKHDLGELLAVIVDGMKSESRRPLSPARIMGEWWRNCIHRSRRVRVETPGRAVTGLNVGVDPEGLLLVETDKGTVEKFSEGTLRVLS